MIGNRCVCRYDQRPTAETAEALEQRFYVPMTYEDMLSVARNMIDMAASVGRDRDESPRSATSFRRAPFLQCSTM
jgi:hypothetical protein